MFKMVGKRNAFDQEMFDKYDVPARTIIKKALGEFVIDNPDIYQQDLIVTDGECRYKFIELQVFTYWTDQQYPDELFVYERKAKYELDTLFITLNKDMTMCLIFDAQSFKYSKPRRLKKYSREFVYDVPKHRIIVIEVKLLTPKFIKFSYWDQQIRIHLSYISWLLLMYSILMYGPDGQSMGIYGSFWK